MLPWLKCALTEACINPIGAQSTGCRFDKKPQYRYSGCHSYDVSALNIVLGSMFAFHESSYISNKTFITKFNKGVAARAGLHTHHTHTTKAKAVSAGATPYLNISEYGLV